MDLDEHQPGGFNPIFFHIFFSLPRGLVGASNPRVENKGTWLSAWQ